MTGSPTWLRNRSYPFANYCAGQSSLIPTVSSLQTRNPRFLPALYRESYRLIFFLSIPAFAFLVIAAPIVSRIWIGSYEPVFVGFVALLAGGWLMNVLANPAYVFDLGTGALRWVTVGCATTGLVNACLGFALGKQFGGVAVVAVSAASLAIGYIIVLVSYHLHNGAPFGILVPNESNGIIFSSVAGVLIFLPAFCSAFSVEPAFHPCSLGGVRCSSGNDRHPDVDQPLRKRLTNWAFSRLPA